MTDYLPGVNVVLNDLGLKVAPPPAGPKITLLGITSNTGIPINEPFTVSSVEKAINSLYFNMSGVAGGWPDNPFPGELSLAIEEAVNGGAPNIEVVVIGHYSADALLSYISPTGSCSGRYVDLSGAYDVLRNRELNVVVPVNAYIDDVIYNPAGAEIAGWNFGKQLADFCFQATTEENSCVGVIGTRPVMSWAYRHAPATGFFGNQYYTGIGSDATLNSELDSLFTEFYVSSGAAPAAASVRSSLAAVEYGTPSVRLTNEWHAFNTYPHKTTKFNSQVYHATNYSSKYLAWLSGAADQNGATLSDIAVASATAVNPAYFTSWQAIDSDGVAATDSRGNKVDAGAYISVFSTPLKATGTQVRSRALALGGSVASTARNTDGVAAYAGLITSLAPQSATTNKQVGGVVQLKLLSARQANDLTGMRHVTMYSRTRGLTVASGVTGAYNVSLYVRSDYVRLSTVRIVHAVVDLIRSVSEKFIGEPNNAPQMNAMDAEIDQVLLSMKGSGALNSYQFSISATPDQRVLGQLDINLTLVPAFEITDINLTVSLSKEL